MSILQIALQRLAFRPHSMRKEDKIHIEIWQKQVAQAVTSHLTYLLAQASFYASRTNSITQSRGSGTPTETRATVATVMGYSAAGTIAGGQDPFTLR